MEEDFSIQLKEEGVSLPFRGLFAVCDIYDDIIGAVLLDGDVCTTFTTDGCTVTSSASLIKKWAKRGQMVLGQDKQHNNKVELLVLDINYEPLDFYLVPLLKREGQKTIILSRYEKYRERIKDIIPEMWKNEHLSAVKPQRGTKEPRL